MQHTVISLKDVLKDNDNFRFDADYFYPPAYKLYKKIIGSKFSKIKKCFHVTKLAGFEYTKYFTENNMLSDNYYIVLTSKNIQREELVINDYLKIDKPIADEFLRRSKIKKEDLVLSYTGEYRRSLVMQENGFQLGPNICLMRKFDDEINNYYLSAYLNSSIGQLLLYRERTLSGQPTVPMSSIRNIPVANFSNSFQSLIKNIILKAINNQIKADKIYKDAEKILLNEFNFSKWKLKHYLSFEEKFSNISKISESKRFDSEYFQPKYNEIVKQIKNYKKGYEELKYTVCIKDEIFKPEDKTNYNYIELANISLNGNINGFIEDLGENLPTRARLLVNHNDVIVSSIEGSLSSIALINKELDNSFCSTGFFVTNSKKINSETLLVFFKSPIGQLQLKKGSSGTILRSIEGDEFKKILIPKINIKLQDEIKNKIQKMYEIKKISSQLHEISKLGIEMAVNNSEKNAITWIKKKISSAD